VSDVFKRIYKDAILAWFWISLHFPGATSGTHEYLCQDVRSMWRVLNQGFQQRNQECFQLDREIWWDVYWEGETEIIGGEQNQCYLSHHLREIYPGACFRILFLNRFSKAQPRTLMLATVCDSAVTYLSVVQYLYLYWNLSAPKHEGKSRKEKTFAGCLKSDVSTGLESGYKE
jgi:hypothetical protein